MDSTPINARASQAEPKEGFFQKIGQMIGEMLGGAPSSAGTATNSRRVDTFSKEGPYSVAAPRALQTRLVGQVGARTLPSDPELLGFLNHVR